jgi:hypothetical protein
MQRASSERDRLGLPGVHTAWSDRWEYIWLDEEAGAHILPRDMAPNPPTC